MALRLSTKTDIYKLKDKEVFFDANILIYLFWPTGSHKFENHYAMVFSKLLKQENTLIIDFTTISEFINRAIKSEFEKYKIDKKKYSLKFKEYRNSNIGQESIQDIYEIVKNDIFRRFEVAGKKFLKYDITKMLVLDFLDFGDKAILTICKENDYILLTNDSDFKDSEIDILSSNKDILNN